MKEKFSAPSRSPEKRDANVERESARVELGIRPPDGDKNFMVTFVGKTEEECMAYNGAIRKILERERLMPFHQKGVTPFGKNQPGLHGWEVHRSGVTEERLRSLFEEIQKTARELL